MYSPQMMQCVILIVLSFLLSSGCFLKLSPTKNTASRYFELLSTNWSSSLLTIGATTNIEINTSGHAVINAFNHRVANLSVEVDCKYIMAPDTINAVLKDIIAANRIIL